MADSYRIRLYERDLAGFASQNNFTVGAAVVRSKKGKGTPTLVTSQTEVTSWFGTPSSQYWGVYEAIDYCRPGNPLWLVRALGSNYRYSGIDITSTSIVPFGTGAGRVPGTIDYTDIQRPTSASVYSGDGLTATISGASLSNVPVIGGSLVVKNNGIALNITESGGVLSGTDVSSGTLTLATGAYSLTFSGTVGTVASYTSLVDLAASPIDLTLLSKALAFNLTIDGVLYENISTGLTDSSFNNADLALLINTAIGTTIATIDIGGGILIEGLIGDAINGGIIIEDPTDLVTYDSGVTDLFDATFIEGASNQIIEDTASTNPTGAVPSYGDAITFEWTYTTDESLNISFSLFAASPYNDDIDPIAVNVVHTTGSRYKVTLYKVDVVKGNSIIEEQEVSLIEETDYSGKQLLITEIFNETHPYLYAVINDLYVGTALPVVSSEVTLTGGDEGDAPTALQYASAWQNFRQVNKYKAKIFMDFYGLYYDSVKDLVLNYQWWGHGITVVPRGNNVSQAITYRDGLNVTTDRMSLYFNWLRIKDNQFTNTKVWTSRVGHIGQVYAASRINFDGGKHAGATDFNGQSGLLNNGFPVVESDYDVTETEKQLLDDSQINPLIIDPTYGPMIDGDKTLLPYNTDTSFVATRKTYNYLKLKVYEEVLRQQVFSDNDAFHREIAARKAYEIVNPMIGRTLRAAKIICDESNNTDAVLQARNFVIDIVVQATPNSQFVNLYLDRLGQTQEINTFVPST